jgi:hypothetical protein
MGDFERKSDGRRIFNTELKRQAVDAGEDVVPLSRVRELERQIKELQRLIGKQAVTIEILEAARELRRTTRPHPGQSCSRVKKLYALQPQADSACHADEQADAAGKDP